MLLVAKNPATSTKHTQGVMGLLAARPSSLGFSVLMNWPLRDSESAHSGD
jgi:hypothetical protein